MAKGKISSLVIQALREIGKDKATPAELEKITKLLKEEDPRLLRHDIKLAPEWIRQIMKGAGVTRTPWNRGKQLTQRSGKGSCAMDIEMDTEIA